jgi:hypothetical protein
MHCIWCGCQDHYHEERHRCPAYPDTDVRDAAIRVGSAPALITLEERLLLIDAAHVVRNAGYVYLKDRGSVWGHKTAKDAAAILLAIASREIHGKGGNE